MKNKLVGALTLSVLAVFMLMPIAFADGGKPPKDQTCKDIGFDENRESDSSGVWGSVDFSDDQDFLTLVVNEGWEVQLCVKAGSANQGLGPEVTEWFGEGEYEVEHSSGKDLSHYDWVKRRVDDSTTTTEPEVTTTSTLASTTTTEATTTTEGPTTTTEATTTTSAPDQSTTTVPEETTTTAPQPTTTVPEVTTTVPGETTTVPPPVEQSASIGGVCAVEPEIRVTAGDGGYQAVVWVNGERVLFVEFDGPVDALPATVGAIALSEGDRVDAYIYGSDGALLDQTNFTVDCESAPSTTAAPSTTEGSGVLPFTGATVGLYALLAAVALSLGGLVLYATRGRTGGSEG